MNPPHRKLQERFSGMVNENNNNNNNRCNLNKTVNFMKRYYIRQERVELSCLKQNYQTEIKSYPMHSDPTSSSVINIHKATYDVNRKCQIHLSCTSGIRFFVRIISLPSNSIPNYCKRAHQKPNLVFVLAQVLFT